MTSDEILQLKGEAHNYAREQVPDIRERALFDHIRDARLIQLVEEKVRQEITFGWRKRQIKQIED